ncbi:helix-turn-helix domain-containing protein [Arthrobacter sp. 2MCAF15]|uniref:helix-turn-helix domain-containing protein n=1 Tax=Arthrobacter sp. 2MCAF15 TaxID=3232984 RepID=UPI003F8F7E41
MTTIRELVHFPDAGARLIAGGRGETRFIDAANVCAETDPWRWLSSGELLMVTRDALPADSRGQQFLIQQLDRHGIVGLAASDPRGNSPFSEVMCRTAEHLGFPLLQVNWETPFSTLAAFVSKDAAEQAQAGLNKVADVYEAYSKSLSRTARPFLSDEISSMLGIRVEVVEAETGCSLFTRSTVDSGVLNERRRLLNIGSTGSADRRAAIAGRDYYVLPIKGRHHVWLMTPADQEVVDRRSLLHLCTLFAVEVERYYVEHNGDSSALTETMVRYFGGLIDVEQALNSLARRGLGQPPWRVIDVGAEASSDFLLCLKQAGIPHIPLTYAGGVSVLVDAVRFDEDRGAAGAGQELPQSDKFWSIESFTDAARSAAWARHLASEQYQRPNLIGRALAPATLTGARELVETVLGALVEYDASHRSDLVRSLEYFLACNRSWESASTGLHVHRQTLRYRLGRVTELTGRRLDNMDDLVELHVALKIQRILEAMPVPMFGVNGARRDDEARQGRPRTPGGSMHSGLEATVAGPKQTLFASPAVQS